MNEAFKRIEELCNTDFTEIIKSIERQNFLLNNSFNNFVHNNDNINKNEYLKK